MNRRERRIQAKKAQLEAKSAPAPSPLPQVLGTSEGTAPQGTVLPSFTLGPQAAQPGTDSKPSLALRLFARLLLAKWLIKRIYHPDLVAILLQIAQQTGRSDVVATLTLKLYGAPRG